jgi:threonine synthase
MKTGRYSPKPSSPTISNAMDVGDPSNFVRIRNLYGNDLARLSKNLSSFSFTDPETKQAIGKIHKQSGYIADPHGAVGYLGLKAYLAEHPEIFGIFLETAHPVKFLEVVEGTLGIRLDIPPQIEKVLRKEKKSVNISTYQELKTFLLNR